jgi:Na+-translocating ferredoxin:NAD+ oxidoreductase RnfD subunit
MSMSQAVTRLPTVGRRSLSFDPRYGQMAAQSTLLLIELVWLDFGPSRLQAAVFIITALVMEAARARLTGTAWNWKSAASTGLSLSLLLRSHNPLLWVGAGVIAMGSKYLIRINGKHLFNPSACAIVVLLLTTSQVWVSPGQWGTRFWLVALAVSMGCLILSRVARLDIACAFLSSFTVLLLFRAWSLGDPLAIPLHQVQSGALLIFALFMLTDPRSTPDSRTGRLTFGAATAGAAYLLLFRFQVREGLLYALILVSCTTPLIDRLWPGLRFAWPRNKEG